MSETEAVVLTKKVRIAPIWIVPIVTVILGVWLAVNAYLDQGPTVYITFSSASGIVAGKTRVKVLNVDIGVVTDIRLADDAGGVTVEADLDPEARRLLREDTEFWVVRPSVSGLNFSGLGTILSGAYVELSPGVEKATGVRTFKGLDAIPQVPLGTPGIRLRLVSEGSVSVNVGSPVHYLGFKIGAVEDVSLEVDTQQVSYSIFIDAPYDRLVNSNTRFWNTSGILAELGAEGVRLEIGSLQTLLSGGVSFGLPQGFEPGEPATENATYRLYPDEQSIHEDPHRFSTEYVVEISESLKGLYAGAPVSYRGLRLGTVERIMVNEIDADAMTAGTGPPIPVLISLEPGRLDFGDTQEGVETLRQTVRSAVSNGLRATLETGSLITGSRYVGLDFYSNTEAAEQGVFKDYPTIPMTTGGLGHLQTQVSQLLDKLNNLPVEDTLDAATQAIAELEQTLTALRSLMGDDAAGDLLSALEETLHELNSLMQGYSSESEFNRQLNRTLDEIKNTLNSVQGVTDRLADNPNSIVFPGKPFEDPEPKAPRQ